MIHRRSRAQAAVVPMSQSLATLREIDNVRDAAEADVLRLAHESAKALSATLHDGDSVESGDQRYAARDVTYTLKFPNGEQRRDHRVLLTGSARKFGHQTFLENPALDEVAGTQLVETSYQSGGKTYFRFGSFGHTGSLHAPDVESSRDFVANRDTVAAAFTAHLGPAAKRMARTVVHAKASPFEVS